MWSVSGIFLNAQKVITTQHYSVLTGIKSGNKRHSIFKMISLKKLQKYRNSTRSESAKTRYFNKKQLVLKAEKCLQQFLFVNLTQFDAASYQESTQLPSKNAILNNYITNLWKTIFFQKFGYYNYYPVENLKNFCKLRPSSFTLKLNSKDSGQTVLVSAVFYCT